MTYEFQVNGVKGFPRWDGTTPENAITRYQDAHPGSVITAWRVARDPEVIAVERLDHIRIFEPGDRGY